MAAYPNYSRFPGPGDLSGPDDPQNEADDRDEAEPTCWVDPLFVLRSARQRMLLSRRYRLRGAAMDSAVYRLERQRMFRPALRQLRMIESAIRCDVACRDALNAWRDALNGRAA